MAWSQSGTTLNFAGAGNSLDDCAGDGIPTTGTSYVLPAEVAHKFWVIYNFIATASGTGAVWEDKDKIIAHVEGSAINQLIDFAENDSNKVLWGVGDLTIPEKPIVYAGNHYILDQNGFVGGYGWAGSSGVFENGSADIFGGTMMCWPVLSGSGAGTLWYWPQGTVRLIGTNFILYGGIRFQHASGRLQELKMGGSRRKGTSMPEVVDVISVKDVIFMDNVNHLSYSSYAASDERFLNTAVRGYNDTGEINFDTTWDNDGLLDNSDNIEDWNGGMSNASLTERVSYDITTINESGSDLQDVNVRVTRTLQSAAGSEPPTYSPNFLEVAIGATDVNGERPQLWLTRRTYSSATTPVRTHYSGFFTTLRKYGYDYEYIAKYPVYGAAKSLVDTIIMKTNLFTVGTEVAVAAYTGIAMDQGTETITVSSDHTVQEVYDWLQWECAKQTNMDFESGGNGVEKAPLNTADGSVFVVEPGWTLAGTSFITLDGKILELANGDRTVGVSLTGIEPGSSYVIQQTGGAVLYSGIIYDSGAFYAERSWTTNIDVTITVRLQGYAPVVTTAQINNTGLNVAINSALDPRYKINDGRFEQTHFRWRNDNGSETSATWKAAEDTDITGETTGVNIRLRIQIDELVNKPGKLVSPKLQYREVGNDIWEDVP